MQKEENELERKQIKGTDQNLNEYKKSFSEAAETFVFKNTKSRDYQEFKNKLDEQQIKEELADKNFYEVKMVNKGGLVMPVIIEWTYVDGTKEVETLPAEIWRHNEQAFTKIFVKEKEVVNILIDPDKATADVDQSNNRFPKMVIPTRFDKFKKDN